jgi:hypothetical protein
MPKNQYRQKIFQVIGEEIKPNPDHIFDTTEVYLFIDKNLSIIWIWAGEKSKLFHRYIASSWAGKLKSKKKYYNYNYELIKQGREPEDFLPIINEIEEGRTDLSYPGESRTLEIESKKNPPKSHQSNVYQRKISNTKASKINSILSEIQEMQQHIQYSMQHIGKRIEKINKILNE